MNFISAGVLTTIRETVPGVHIASASNSYDNPPAINTLSITWNSFIYDPDNPVFVVIYVNPQAGCTTSDNIKVYKIMPINAFTLDIANVGADKQTVAPYETSINRCINKVVSSQYILADDAVKMDFGQDSLYYVVTAANFSVSWLPRFRVPTIDPLETIVAVEWFRPTDGTFSTPGAMPWNADSTAYIATNPVLVLDPSGTVGAVGECIVIRVIIDHTNGANMYQGITDETIIAAVDGKTQLSVPFPVGDIHFSNTIGTPADCGKEDAYRNDLATQILLARPDIQNGTVGGTYLNIEP